MAAGRPGPVPRGRRRGSFRRGRRGGGRGRRPSVRPAAAAAGRSSMPATATRPGTAQAELPRRVERAQGQLVGKPQDGVRARARRGGGGGGAAASLAGGAARVCHDQDVDGARLAPAATRAVQARPRVPGQLRTASRRRPCAARRPAIAAAPSSTAARMRGTPSGASPSTATAGARPAQPAAAPRSSTTPSAPASSPRVSSSATRRGRRRARARAPRAPQPDQPAAARPGHRPPAPRRRGAPAEGPRGRIGAAVPDGGGRGEHPLASRARNPVGAVEGIRHDRRRDAGRAGDVAGGGGSVTHSAKRLT